MKYEEIKKALIAVGFKEENGYFNLEGYSIRLYDNTPLDQVFAMLIKCGKTLRAWEIKNILEIIN